MQVKNYDEAREALYPFLRSYLEDNGVDLSNSHFNCLNPDHNDSSPSMSIHPDGRTVHCFGCNASGGIFHVANWIEERSLTFSGFLETLIYLAKKYNIDLEYQEPTEAELYRYNIFAAYKAAADFIKQKQHSSEFIAAIADKDWNSKVCNDLGIGSIASYQELRDYLEKSGFESNFLDEIDLHRNDILHPNRIIFTIQDERGRPVGFAARNLAFTKDKKHGPKYINFRSSGTQDDIYRKGERLFGLFQYLEKVRKKAAPFYLFEGYGDVATSHKHGIWNCGAIGGTALTAEHVNLLKRHHIFDIILCLDGDEAGQRETARLLDEILSGHRDLNIKLVIMPEGTDPDSFLREHGAEAFHQMKKWSAFEWRLAQFSEEENSEEVAHKMIQLVVNETSHITQENMIKTLAKATGITERALTSELDRLQNIKERKIIQDKETIAEKLIRNINKDPNDISIYLHEAQEDLIELEQRYESEVFSEEAMVASIQAHVSDEENKDESDTGFLLGTDLENIEKALLSGDWKKDVWICLGGKPNTGKTSLMTKVAYAIASIKENNACVLYHTIDDTKKQVLPKYAAIANGSRRLMLDDITHPNRPDLINPRAGEQRQIAYDHIRDLAADGRLIIQDQNDGYSLAFADGWIRAYKRKYPDRNIVYILDNFHKLQDMQGNSKDERIRFKELSKRIKDMATKHHCCIITTIEYKKIESGKEATNNDIGETGQIEYDANLIAHLHNDMHERDERAVYVHYHKYDDIHEERLPRLQMKITKNKITGFKGKLWLDFFPACSDFMGVVESTVFQDAKTEQKRLSSDGAEEQQAVEQALQEVRSKNMKPGAGYYKIIDALGYQKDTMSTEETEQVNRIWNRNKVKFNAVS
jgi:DNA primase